MTIYEELCGTLELIGKQAGAKGLTDLARKLMELSRYAKAPVSPLKTHESLYKRYGREITW